MKAISEEQRICARYKKYGVTYDFIRQVVQSGLDAGLTKKAALIGLRMALGEQCGVQEYFAPENVAEITGESVDEVISRIEENKNELISQGGLAEVSFGSPFLQ